MQKEISFTKVLLYVFRRWYVIIVCVAMGIGVGVVYPSAVQTTDIRVYETTVSFRSTEYIRREREERAGGTGYSEEYLISLMNSASTEAFTVLRQDAVKTLVYEEMYEKYGDRLVKGLTESNRRAEFYRSIHAKNEYPFLTFMFAHNITAENKEADIALAKDVVGAYCRLSKEMLLSYYHDIADDTVTLSGIEGENLIKNDIIWFSNMVSENSNAGNYDGIFNMASNEKPSSVISVLFGALCGLAGGIILGGGWYLIDGRIKSIKYKMNEENDRVLGAVQELETSANELFTEIDTQLSLSGSTALLFVIPDGTGSARRFAGGYAAHLKDIGQKTLVIDLFESAEALDIPGVDVQKQSAMEYIANNQAGSPYADYNNVVVLSPNGSIAGYAAGITKAAVFIIDHKTTKFKDFVEILERNAEAKANNLGTVLYHVTNSYLD